MTYGIVRNDEDTLVVIDDSIVRGTTLRQSIIRMLYRLHPRKIVVVSSSPQVRYPDYYGIDMSRMGEFIAFRAAVALLHESGRSGLLDKVYRDCLEQAGLPESRQRNCVKAIYEPFSDEDISRKIAEMLTPPEVKSRSGDRLSDSRWPSQGPCRGHPGDWYFPVTILRQVVCVW